MSTKSRLSWLLMAVVLAAALAIGAAGEREPRTEGERVTAIAAGVRCPTCQGLSAADSDAKAAQAVRDEIRSRIRLGQTGEQIRAYLASRYGEDILLEPDKRGLAGLVWLLPGAGAVAAVAGLVAVFRRGRRATVDAGTPTDDDRSLVEGALVEGALAERAGRG